MVRCRPMNTKEKDRGILTTMPNLLLIDCHKVIKIDKTTCSVSLLKKETNELSKTFTYDSVYDDDSIQQEVYDESAFPLVESVIEGYNGWASFEFL